MACRHNSDSPDTPAPTKPWEVEVPSNLGGKLPALQYPVTQQGFELGKKLFFDPKLSGNNTVSCSSCHKPELAFSDGKSLSNLGTSGNQLLRHTPALMNTAWMKGLFWDGGANDIESLALAPIEHPDEMNQDIKELVKELQADSAYKQLFDNIYPDEGITEFTIIRALGQFQNALVSANSTYDQYIRGEKNTMLSANELKGLELVEKHCSSCHASDLFTDNDYHNNGLDGEFDDHSNLEIKLGRYRITSNPGDIGRFKTPTLRNVAVTAPYMHDGRLGSLKDVLDHYSGKIKQSETLDTLLRTPIALSESEKSAIIDFLQTLTDQQFISNPNFRP